ncbi:helix-turn-helix domain-containing protein [Flavobacterium alkalisoli]|uniref:helix-turn-helix domain-containing protein n=1 Tax=Flavobacterium alkalisoli TaxID=2602769 RepID=UPI003A9577B6
MIELILIGAFVLALATIYMARQIKSVLLFDRICNAFLLFASMQSVFALLSLLVGKDFKFMAIPFFLCYGPFMYFAVKSLINDDFVKRKLYLHYAPSFVAMIVYLVMAEVPLLRGYLYMYNIVLFLSIAFSLTYYSGWILFYENEKHEDNPLANKLIKISAFVLTCMSVTMMVFISNQFMMGQTVDFEVVASILYCSSLFLILLGFRYKVHVFVSYFKGNNEENYKKEIKENPEDPTSDMIVIMNRQKYSKSALNESVFEDYEEKLLYLFEEEKVYLDNEISLEVLAERMKLSKHHLTQLFNVYIGENFNQFINKYRIDYSCSLLQTTDGQLTMEEVAFESGFNSKVSFNRHFKNIMGCTPTDYIKKAG